MVAVDVQEFPDRHEITGGHKLLAGLKAGARRDWWPTLRKLQRSREKAGYGSDRHGSLIARWTELGTTLSFSEEKEHSRHERENVDIARGSNANTIATNSLLLSLKCAADVARVVTVVDPVRRGAKPFCMRDIVELIPGVQ